MPTFPPLFGFGFSHLSMLGWLAAAAAPILIHLWSRRNYHEAPWAAMRWLVAAARRQRRRLRFEQWLLLAVRTGLIVLVVVAVAGPYTDRPHVGFDAAGRIHRMLLLDGSYSMAAADGDTTRFARAKAIARQIVGQARQGDCFSLILMASPPEAVVKIPSVARAEVLDTLDQLQPVDTSFDLPAALQAAEKTLETARREQPELARHELYFLSDMQQAGWSPRLAKGSRDAFRNRARRLSASAAMVVIDVGQPPVDNLAVTRLDTLQPSSTARQPVRLQATVENFGRQARKGQAVELWIDGRRIEQRQVDLPPGAEAAVEFSYQFSTAGDHVAEVRIEGDDLEVDNRRRLVLPLREKLRVLCVDGHPSGKPFGGAADYLAVALRPESNGLANDGIDVDTVAESALVERDLGAYDSVVLCHVAQFTTSEARVLDDYLRGGGSLVFFLGPGVLGQRYNRELLRPGQDGIALLPARIGEPAPDGAYFINPLQYKHPMVAAFRGRPRAGLTTTPIGRYMKLELPRTAHGRVVLAVGKDPLVVEQAVHNGRVVLVATSADTSWNALPVGAAYVPLVQELIRWSVGSRQHQRNVPVGQPLVVPAVPEPGETLATVQLPNGRTREIRCRREGDRGMLRFQQTNAAGLYRVRLGPPVERSYTFAVNPDTTESDLAPIAPESLRRDVWPDVPLQWHTGWDAQSSPALAPAASTAGLVGSLLYAALAMLLLDSLLAWRFGYRTE